MVHVCGGQGGAGRQGEGGKQGRGEEGAVRVTCSSCGLWHMINKVLRIPRNPTTAANCPGVSKLLLCYHPLLPFLGNCDDCSCSQLLLLMQHRVPYDIATV